MKKVTVDWSFCVGEDVIDIQVGRVTPNTRSNGVDIIVLGHHHLFILNEQGISKTQMRLECDPSSLSTYPTPPNFVNHNVVIGEFDTGSLHIYKHTRKVWSAKTDSAPIFTKVGNFGPHKGMIVTLSDEGTLAVSYLGTTPPSSSVVSEGKEINYDEIDEEHRKLLGIIRASQSDTRLEPKEKIILRFQVPKRLDPPGNPHDLDGGAEVSRD